MPKRKKTSSQKQWHCHVIPRPKQSYVHVLLCISPFPPHVKLRANILCLARDHGGFVLTGTRRRPCTHACMSYVAMYTSLYSVHAAWTDIPAAGRCRCACLASPSACRLAPMDIDRSLAHPWTHARGARHRSCSASSSSSVAEQEAAPQVFAATSVTRRPVS